MILPTNYNELFKGLTNKAKGVLAEVESDDDDISDLQGIFNVLEQIEMAKQMQNDDDDSAMVQFWAGLGTALWNTGKGYLKNRYCSQEAEMRAIIEELVDEQETSEAEEGNSGTFTELRNLVNSLNEMTKLRPLMVIDGDVAKSEGWFKKLRKSIKKKAKKLARKVLC